MCVRFVPEADVVNIEYLGLGEAAKREAGSDFNQLPDMSLFASGEGWMTLPNGKIMQFGRGSVTPTTTSQNLDLKFSVPFPKKLIVPC